MEKLKKGKSWCWLLGALFIFVLFYYMTVRTPLAGDDWGYAVNGMSGNPFVKAWEFYFTWSGRYFAELWGFIVAPRKGLWNFLNPALFAGIYVLLYQIVNPKRNPLSVAVLIAATGVHRSLFVRAAFAGSGNLPPQSARQPARL